MNACRPRVADQLADRQANRMRQSFERNDLDIVGAAGQEGVERCAIVFVDDGAGVPFRQAVLPQDRQDGGAGEGAHYGAVRPRIGTTLSAIGLDASSSAARVIASVWSPINAL